LLELTPEQKFTKPPSRFTESSLIKNMEENGIGRPSTYSAILSTLYTRTYVVKEEKVLVPTELGLTIADYLQKYFESIVDIEFTANMEERLDDIEENGADWRAIVDGFYKPFQKQIIAALGGGKMELSPQVSDVKCEKCGALMIYKDGKYGQYLACPNFPECRNIKSLKARDGVDTGIKCDKCGANMLEKSGRFGKYLSCSNYPDCKNMKSLAEAVAVCPVCGGGVSRKLSKSGKPFYGCNNYPGCKFVCWEKPAADKCNRCGKFMTERTSNGTVTVKCSDRACGYSFEKPETDTAAK